MSQVAISGNASGTGTLTIAAPNTNSNYTLTLPAATGTVASIASVNNNGVVYANSSGQPTTDTAFVFDGTNVGIGTSSPAVKLHTATSGNTPIIAETTGGATSYLNLRNTGGQAYIAANSNALVFAVTANATEAARIDSSGNLLVNTTTAQTGAKLAVTGGIQGTIQSGTAVASTSGTSINFTGIPSWVKRITVMLLGVSTSGTSNLQVQLGTGAGPTYTTSGYLGAAISTTGATTAAFASGLLVSPNTTAARVVHGQMVIANITGNNWVASSVVGFSDSAGGNWAAGSISLSAVLTAIRVTTVNGTDTFDAGSINIMYEG